MNRAVSLPAVPKRIISIVPSQTELLFDLGLDQEIIGITKFCIHPSDRVKQKLKIGGTKTLNINLIKKLNPDLIIGNKEENEKTQVEHLMKDIPLWMSDVAGLGGALDMINKLGELVEKKDKAAVLTIAISSLFGKLAIKSASLKVAYLIWRKPYFIAGKGTFIDDMLQKCGLINVFDQERYPEITAQQLKEAGPDVILLSSEPYPFKEKHIREFHSLLPNSTIKLVDGEVFSWYGSRLLHAPQYFQNLAIELKTAEF